ncbi:hypothetical protein F4604DRAFT_1678829 [Suillus subluteus]|nr:hypothetical protein F4604DRAFT_1678829 [Suillus subluteus]
MSQPASQHIGTCPKNATQHPGRIVLEAEGRAKRRSKAQMIADRQRELEEKEASEQAIQQGHQCIATLQEQMATDQAAARIDAPKPKRPRTRPIKKGAKPSATSELSMANGEAGAEVTADKVVGTKGKRGGSGGQSLAQPPSTRYVPPVYYTSPTGLGLKRKLTEEDLLSPSSEVEVLAVVKKEPEAVTLRRTSATSVTVKPKAPATKRLKSSAASTASRTSIMPSQATETPPIVLSQSQYRMKHLPGVFWAIKDSPLRATLQLIWDAVYKGVPYMVTTDGPVIAVALQRLSEWRNSLGTTALVVFANFLRSQADLETDEDREQFSACLLTKSAFLFGTIKEDGSKHTESFQSDLIMQVLAQHHCAISGALAVVPGITTLGHAKGALALATSAMECTIRLFAKEGFLLSHIKINSRGKASKAPQKHNKSTGNKSSALLAFSDANWGAPTKSYIKSITCAGDLVISKMWERAQNLTAKRHGVRGDLDEESEDERALIC